MNIFYLDNDIEKCAQAHADRHVTKMIVETAQLLCTAHRYWGLDWGYKSTHINHPCNIWARENWHNYLWLRDLGLELCKEYTHRYGKVHKTQEIIESCNPPACSYLHARLEKMTPFPQCMPDDCKVKDNAIQAYRKYYLTYKKHMLKYTKREMPEWTKEQK